MSFSVMPDLIRHPEGFEKTGFRLSPERRLSLSRAIYGQTLIIGFQGVGPVQSDRQCHSASGLMWSTKFCDLPVTLLFLTAIRWP